jgi:hypothetical protein
MKRRSSLGVLFCALACAGAVSAQSATAWDESLEGDLSSVGLQPTALAMTLGGNRIVGVVGDSGQGVDRDYFSFTVPAGATLSAVMLLNSTSVSGGASFFAMQGGPQVTVTPAGAGAEALLGFSHYTNDQIGADILPSVVFGPVSVLPSGTYSVWVQETGGPAAYGFDFILSAVPEPAALGMMLAGLLLLRGKRRPR